MGYDYAVAQQVFSDQDKNRVLAIYLNSDISALNATVDWKAAADAFGSASVESFKKMLNYSLKKLQDKGGEEGAAPSPAKPATGRKRKTAEKGDAEGTPKKRGGGRKKKSPEKVEVAAEDNNDEPTAAVKGEDDAFQ